MERIFLDYVLPCLWAFLACVGFTLVFNIHGVGKLSAASGRTGLAGVSAGRAAASWPRSWLRWP